MPRRTRAVVRLNKAIVFIYETGRTRRPLPGVILSAEWNGLAGIDSESVYYCKLRGARNLQQATRQRRLFRRLRRF